MPQDKIFSIVLTVHNKEFLIERVVRAIKQFTTGNYEIVFVFDGCTDDSQTIALKIAHECEINHKWFEAPNVFETKANNIGLKNSSGDYCVILQDDQIVNEISWNERLAKPIETFSDVFAVTGRTAHNWIFNKNSVHLNMKEDLDTCWNDILIHCNHAEKGKIDRDVFAIRDSVNRGPLLIRHDTLEKMGYLDEIYAPQELCEHDLCYRTYKELGMVAGCHWVEILSELQWGGTRPDGHNPAPWLLRTNHKNSKILYSRHKDLICGPKHDENRILK